MQTIAPENWFQNVNLAFDVKVRRYGQLGDKWIVHCVSLPAFLIVIIPRIERIGSRVLLHFGVSVGQISVVVLALVPMVRARLIKERIVGDGRLSQLNFRLIAAVFHQTALDSFHLSHA